MTFSEIKDIAIILGTVVAVCTLIKALVEYMKQNTQKRAEHYIKLRDTFRNDPQFREMFIILEDDDAQLKNLPFQQKQHFIGFYEDIALAVNSKLLKMDVAHYMFSYYAIRCWESEYFWDDIEKNSVYWSLFKHFVEKMKLQEEKLLKNSQKTKTYKI